MIWNILILSLFGKPPAFINEQCNLFLNNKTCSTKNPGIALCLDRTKGWITAQQEIQDDTGFEVSSSKCLKMTLQTLWPSVWPANFLSLATGPWEVNKNISWLENWNKIEFRDLKPWKVIYGGRYLSLFQSSEVLPMGILSEAAKKTKTLVLIIRVMVFFQTISIIFHYLTLLFWEALCSGMTPTVNLPPYFLMPKSYILHDKRTSVWNKL